MVAQCNLTPAPTPARGGTRTPSSSATTSARALGARFVQFVGAGEVDGDPAGGFRYKVTVQGRQGDVGVLWHYYLIAGPEGDQLLATFTLAAAQAAVRRPGHAPDRLAPLDRNRPKAEDGGGAVAR